MEDLTNRQKRHLHEVADLMLEIYRTLVRMQFLDPLWIQEGPHDISALLPLYESHNLDPAIIYLYSILPYVDMGDVSFPEDLAFFQRSTFADFRKKGDVDQGRDPLYDAEDEEPILREWMTPLSKLGNHGSLIIYDARTHCVAIIDHESCGSGDHGRHHQYERYPDTRWVEGAGCEEEDESSEESGSEGGLEDDMSEDGTSEEGSEEDMSEDEEEEGSERSERLYDEMDSRPARNVLKDIVQWYHNLVEIPSGEGMWDPDIVIPLYRKHGWPGADFDGDAFLIDQARAAAASSAKYNAEEPIHEVSKYRGWIVDEKSERMQQVREKIASAKTEDEEWLARWELWNIERINQNCLESLRTAEEALDRACPDGSCQKPEDLILWEERELREESWSKKRTLEVVRQQAEQTETGERCSVRGINLKLRHAEKEAEVYRKAHEAARLEAERLCPGRSFASGPGVEKHGIDLQGMMVFVTGHIDSLKPHVKSVQDWVTKLPDGAQQARKQAQDAVDEMEKSLQRFLERRDHLASELSEMTASN